MMKKIICIIAAALFLGVSPVMAETPLRDATKAAARQETNITRLKTRADAEITRRVTALNLLLTKINAMKRITSDQKTTFTNGINGQISALNTLKTKIDADTDIATLRTDVQSIVKAYRIFALYMPQVNVMAHADRLLALVDEMNAISTKLQTRIDTAKAAGKDTASMQTLMTDRAVKLTDATTQANNAIAAVVVLTPDGYPGNKTSLQSAQKMLQAARQDLVAAEKDATQIRQTLKSLGLKPTGTVTPTPTP